MAQLGQQLASRTCLFLITRLRLLSEGNGW